MGPSPSRADDCHWLWRLPLSVTGDPNNPLGCSLHESGPLSGRLRAVRRHGGTDEAASLRFQARVSHTPPAHRPPRAACCALPAATSPLFLRGLPFPASPPPTTAHCPHNLSSSTPAPAHSRSPCQRLDSTRDGQDTSEKGRVDWGRRAGHLWLPLCDCNSDVQRKGACQQGQEAETTGRRARAEGKALGTAQQSYPRPAWPELPAPSHRTPRPDRLRVPVTVASYPGSGAAAQKSGANLGYEDTDSLWGGLSAAVTQAKGPHRQADLDAGCAVAWCLLCL